MLEVVGWIFTQVVAGVFFALGAFLVALVVAPIFQIRAHDGDDR